VYTRSARISGGGTNEDRSIPISVSRAIHRAEMRGSEVGDEWAEDDGVDALADREHGCDAGQERGRPELRVDQRRRQDAEERNRPERARRGELPARE